MRHRPVPPAAATASARSAVCAWLGRRSEASGSEAAAGDGEAGELPLPALERERGDVGASGPILVSGLEDEAGGRLQHGAVHARPETGEPIEARAREQGAGESGGRVLEAEGRANRAAIEAAIAEQDRQIL